MWRREYERRAASDRELWRRPTCVNYAGYVKQWRKVRKNPLWTQLPSAVFKFFSYCVMEAKWEPESWYDGDGEIFVPAGSFITSYREMAKDCHLGVQQIRDALRHLNNLGITRSSVVKSPGRTHEMTMVTLLNYHNYNSRSEEEEHAKEHTNNTRRNTRPTRDQHAKKNELEYAQPNSLQLLKTGTSNERPLKEEEIKNRRNVVVRAPALIVAALRVATGTSDDDAAVRIVNECRANVPDATEEEIVLLIEERARVIGRRVVNPMGLLIRMVPKSCTGEILKQRRAEAGRARLKAEERRAHEQAERRQLAQSVIDSQSEWPAEQVEWARSMLSEDL